MARGGVVFRLLKPCAVAAFLIVVASCGGGGAPSGPEVVRITIAGMPGTPLAPMQTAQLTATATYSDGTLEDVSGAATWDSTNRDVVTVSSAGLATATGAGKAEVSAVFAGVRGAAAGDVVALPSAYLIDGLDYAFDYQLDTLGRVINYRISRRDGVSYPTDPWADPHPKQCTGNLRGSYSCSATTYSGYYIWSMTGEAGRLVTIPIFCTGCFSYTYVYGENGLVQFKKEGHTGTIHQTGPTTTMTLAYDAAGRPNDVQTSCYGRVSDGFGYRVEKTARITLDSLGRLLHEDVTTVVIPFPALEWNTPDTSECTTTDALDWTYDAIGYMKTAGSTEYTADADGWLTSRRRVSGADTLVDTYAITRFGGRVAEEQFTQAEPSACYTERSDSQRVRYEWRRLPTEPLFVPRALTGKNGADYLGIISSHSR